MKITYHLFGRLFFYAYICRSINQNKLDASYQNGVTKMRTIRTKVYKFEELTPEAQQVAIEYRRRNNEINLGMFHDSAKEQIESKGFYDNLDLSYSLSWSQGDGLSFSCDRFEIDKLLKIYAEVLGTGKEKTAKIIADYCSFTAKGNKGHYQYASKSDIDYELDDYNHNSTDRIEEIISKVEEKLKDLYLTLCKDLEKEGYADIEHQNSDEFLKQDIINNNDEFLKDGTLFDL